ncbi:MAG: tRNA pseudouridine(38-40) synthase TruA [Oscillospiraceae bacterium]|nr:tRNA pseudouridine(38-40) synthase TruA [Oscillospiraceae bacterium]
MSAHNYLADLSFVGTAYHGSQIQKNAVTVQELFQNALEAVLGKLPDIKCCSRTDTGVHARHFYVSFAADDAYDCRKLTAALNAHLPFDIRVLGTREVPADFHARYSAKGKKYEYLVWNGDVMDPFLIDRAYHFTVPIDEKLLDETAKVFLGTHDFSSFCSSKSSVEDKTRTVSEACVIRQGDLIRFSFAADGFLYNMVRIMTGALLQVSRGKLDKSGILLYLNGKTRDSILITVPACGLYLTEVMY